MARTPPTTSSKTFVSHARVIGLITLVSRVLGLGREMVAAAFFGAGPTWSAFTVAFTVPNLFRKLFGEGALSAAFIPLYAKALADPDSKDNPRAFAAGSVNLLVVVLTIITVVGELILAAVWLFADVGRDDYELAIILTAIMLPYVVLICGAAFLGGVLNVHDRFAAPAAASVMLNLCLIVAILAAALVFDLRVEPGRVAATMWLAGAVLVSGVLQVLMLRPSLRAAGFAFDPRAAILTPATRKMLRLSLPVALSAGVLQIGVLLDKGLAFFLASPPGTQSGGAFAVLGYSVPYPLAEGAAARLNWAQFMYQFPLGVFAIALATAIFPKLSRDAALDGGRNDAFRGGLRQGVEAALFIGLPASAGLVLVREPAVRVLFERGQFTPFDTGWTALSVGVYGAAVWAFSLQQILGRAYYALGDMTTPLVWAVLNLLANVVVELPLIWTPLGEAGMAVGTLVSFAAQSVLMLWVLDRRLGGLGLGRSAGPVLKMLSATALMVGACVALRWLPGWPAGVTTRGAAVQLLAMLVVGGGVYLGAARAMGLRRLI